MGGGGGGGRTAGRRRWQRGGCGCGRSGCLLGSHTGGVYGAIFGNSHRRDFAFSHFIKHKTIARRRNAQHQPVGIGARDEIALTVERQRTNMGFFALEEHGPFAIRGYAVNFALVTRGDKEIAFAIEGQRPNVFCLRVVEDLGLAVRRDFVDFTIGGRAHEDSVLVVDRNGMNLDRLKFRECLFLSTGRDAKQPCARSAAGIEIALGIACQRPQIRGRGIVNLFKPRRQRKAPVAAQR